MENIYMSQNFTTEILDNNLNFNWNLNDMLSGIPEGAWQYAYHYNNKSYVCNLGVFPTKLDDLYTHIINLQDFYKQQTTLTDGQTRFINSTINKSQFNIYKTFTDTDGIPVYNNISKLALVIGIANSNIYGTAFAPTYPIDASIVSDNIQALDFDNFPNVTEILEDNKLYIMNRSIPVRGKRLDIPPDYRYLIVSFIQ